jgi:hypothetical protein
MPPWQAAEPPGTFANDRRLTATEKNTIIQWVTGGAPEGNPKELPPPKFTEGWEIGAPDVILTMKPYSVPASGTINYQYFTVPTNFTEDKWAQAIEVRPGDHSVVHHALIFSREPGTALGPAPAGCVQIVPNMTRSGTRIGPGTLIASTGPGTNAMIFELGPALRIKAGSTLVFQIHYTANGRITKDQTSVGIVFSKQTPRQEILNTGFQNMLLHLPAGAPDTEVPSAIEFTEDPHIDAIFPHTHLRGKSFEYRLVGTDRQSKVVLSVPKYDFNWQTYYVFATPIAVTKGSRLECVAHYDNSAGNPSNPDPTVGVVWGEQTWQEMQYTGITYSLDTAEH